jgi:pimeloyl-ACP methyl ester carboxylesterase
MLSRRIAAMGLGLAALALMAGVVRAQAAPGTARRSAAHVYVLSGLMNMSPGFDDLAQRIRQRGIAATVSNHNLWGSLAEQAIADYKRGQLRAIAIVGHSMGGGAALDMAAELGRAGVPVELVVTIDPVGTTVVPSNVRRTVNLYVRGGIGAPIQRASKSRGAVQNVPEANPDIGHFSIIAARETQVLGLVLAATGARSAPAATQKDSATATHN